MQFIIFILGMILGAILRDIKFESTRNLRKLHDAIISQEKAQFIDPIPFKEKFDKSKNLTDLLNG